jgi:arsenite methyltransferase
MSDNSIHKVVRDRYGSIARSIKTSPAGQTDSCCGDSADCCPGAGLYNVKMLDDLPLDVTGLSLGCGDPVSIASLRPGETVLDLGSGGGIDCFLAAREVGETGRVIGVDMTPDMLLRANANKAKMGVKNVEFRQGQIEALPVDSSSIDVIMSNCVINLSPDKASVFREAFRVLKPGGRVSISDIVTEGDFSPELRAQTDKWAECVTGAIDASVYMGIMLDAGFVDIEVVNKTDAGNIIPREEGMPRIFSARITGHKPAGSEIHPQTRSA